MQVRNQLQDIRQGPNESMYDYLEKFNALEQSCCNLGVPEKLIIEYLLDGLRPLDRMLLDVSAGGTIMNLSPAGVMNLIAEVAESARFREETIRQEELSRTRNVSKAETLANPMVEELKQMKEMMQKLVMNQVVQVRPCEFCGAIDHKTDAYPIVVEEEQGDVNALNGFQNYSNRAPERQYGQTANGQSWRIDNNAPREPAHQATSQQTQQAAPQQTQQYNYYRPPYRQQQGGYNSENQYQQRGQNYNQTGPSNQNSSKSLEEVVKELAASTQQLATMVHQNQAKTDGAIFELSKQISQVATTVSKPKNDPRRLPTQTIPNSKSSVNAVTLRSGKELNDSEKEAELVQIAPARDISATLMSKADVPITSGPNTPIMSRPNVIHTVENPKTDFSLPFPMQVKAPKKHMIDKDVWELFSKVEINIPLLEAIKQILRYAKFLNDLCTNRRRSTHDE
ncbi:unnamed protein product [Rhodiola kirilowii]